MVVNQPPVADASATPTQVISPNNVDALVTLSGSGSSDPDGDALTFAWSADGTPVATTEVATVTLAVGDHGILLEVNDGTVTDDDSPTGWGPCPQWGESVANQGIYAIVAENPSIGQLAIAIQGTQNIWDLIKDFKVVPQPAFPPIAGAAIAQGSQDGLTKLVAMQNTGGQTLQEFLNSLPQGTCLLVTGHSLGGNLASVLAPWIAANIPAFNPNLSGPLSALPANLNTITFATPTAGNAAFANFLANQTNCQAFFNQNDAIPYAWATTCPWAISHINCLFPAPGPSPAPQIVQKIIQDKVKQMQDSHVSYTQTPAQTFTFTPAAPPTGAKDPWGGELGQWGWELAYEHNYAYCVTFLGPHAGCKLP